MPDLRKILFGARDKNYVDVTALSAPSKRKAPFVLKRKKNVFKIRPHKVRIKKIKASKPLVVKRILKKEKPKALGFLSKMIQSPKKVAKPFQKSLKPPKAVLKPPKPIKAALPKAEKQILAGEVVHFFDKIQVCVIKLKSVLKVGDQLHFKGKITDFTQILDSMQIDHQQVMMAKKGNEVGLKVKEEVHVGDKVFLV